MNSKLVLSVLLAGGVFSTAGASELPANKALLKQCESAQGEVKKECEEVAKDMIRNDTPTQERDDKTSQDITHSSPAMTKPDETEAKGAKQKRTPAEKKDPAASKPTPPEPAQ